MKRHYTAFVVRLCVSLVAAALLAFSVVVISPGVSTEANAVNYPYCVDYLVPAGQGVSYAIWVPGRARANTVVNRQCLAGTYNQTKYAGVLHLQDTLNYCFGKNLALDGKFGTNTYNALRSVQSNPLRVTADGIYGPKTHNAMYFAGPTGVFCYYDPVKIS